MISFKQILEITREEGIKALGKKGSRQGMNKFLSLPLLNKIAFKLSIDKLEKKKKKEEKLSDILDTAFSFKGYGLYGSIKPAQLRVELRKLAKIVKNRDPSIVMEIGTAKGGTFYVLSRYLKDDSTLISLDLPGGRFGGGYSEKLIPFFQNFSEEKEMAFFRKNSHKIKTKKEIKKYLSNKKIDFLFIDGDHTFKGVKHDFKMYKPLVSDDGIIAFHDILSGPSQMVGQVPKFWDQINKDFKTQEIIKNYNQKGYGIGLLFK